MKKKNRTFKVDVTDGVEYGWPSLVYLLAVHGDDVWSGIVDLDYLDLSHMEDAKVDTTVDELTAEKIQEKIEDALDEIAKKLHPENPYIGPYSNGLRASLNVIEDLEVRDTLVDAIENHLQNKEITV